jgi:hypothetical protein
MARYVFVREACVRGWLLRGDVGDGLWVSAFGSYIHLLLLCGVCVLILRMILIRDESPEGSELTLFDYHSGHEQLTNEGY